MYENGTKIISRGGSRARKHFQNVKFHRRESGKSPSATVQVGKSSGKYLQSEALAFYMLMPTWILFLEGKTLLAVWRFQVLVPLWFPHIRDC